MICVSISTIGQLEKILDSEVFLLELRLDLIKEEPESIYPLIPKHIKTVATCRPDHYPESERIDLLKRCMDLGATYVDVEIESADKTLALLTKHAKACGTMTIISYHNFHSTPSEQELKLLLQQCFEKGGDVAKLAVQVNSRMDLFHVLELYKLPGKKVVLGMGKMGRITRLMGPYLGAEFTFGAPDKGSETAPGQFSYKQLTDIYKVIDES